MILLLIVPVDGKSCPLNLTPTAVAMEINSCYGLVEEQNISRVDFATNHPARNLGKTTLKTKIL